MLDESWHNYSFGWNRTYERAYDRVFGRFTDDLETEDKDGQSVEQGVESINSHRGAPKLHAET